MSESANFDQYTNLDYVIPNNLIDDTASLDDFNEDFNDFNDGFNDGFNDDMGKMYGTDVTHAPSFHRNDTPVLGNDLKNMINSYPMSNTGNDEGRTDTKDTKDPENTGNTEIVGFTSDTYGDDDTTTLDNCIDYSDECESIENHNSNDSFGSFGPCSCTGVVEFLLLSSCVLVFSLCFMDFHYGADETLSSFTRYF